MQRKPRQARDSGKVLVESEHAGAMLERNRGNEYINRCQADTLGTPQPENRGRLPIGSETRGSNISHCER